MKYTPKYIKPLNENLDDLYDMAASFGLGTIWPISTEKDVSDDQMEFFKNLFRDNGFDVAEEKLTNRRNLRFVDITYNGIEFTFRTRGLSTKYNPESKGKLMSLEIYRLLDKDDDKLCLSFNSKRKGFRDDDDEFEYDYFSIYGRYNTGFLNPNDISEDNQRNFRDKAIEVIQKMKESTETQAPLTHGEYEKFLPDFENSAYTDVALDNMYGGLEEEGNLPNDTTEMFGYTGKYSNPEKNPFDKVIKLPDGNFLKGSVLYVVSQDKYGEVQLSLSYIKYKIITPEGKELGNGLMEF